MLLGEEDSVEMVVLALSDDFDFELALGCQNIIYTHARVRISILSFSRAGASGNNDCRQRLHTTNEYRVFVSCFRENDKERAWN
jgi:hypothetical protein